MKKTITALAFATTLVSACPCYCQYTDSLPVMQRDTLPAVINWNTPASKKIFPYTSFILPATLVVYGVTSLSVKPLGSINQKIKEEVYTERSSAAKIHIDNYLQYSPALAVYALNLAGIQGKNNFRDRSMIYGLSELIMSSTVFTVKKFAGETRPDGTDKYSFPSGHTANAFAAAEFMRQEYKDISPWYGVAGYAMAAATGYLRMYNNRHWMSDVAAGAGVGIISTKLAYWIYPAIKRKLFKNKEVSTMVMPSYQNGSIGLGMVHHF
ncbi:MAG: phosphatase PAP2 family protein [Bacteroidota bacterium]